MSRKVLAICQYALPTSEPGITRHAELLARADGWEATIVAGDVNYSTRRRFATDDPRFVLVRSFTVRGNGPVRILTWVHFGVASFVRAMRMPRPDVVYASSPPLLGLLAAVALKRMRRVPLVIEVRDLWPEAAVAMGVLRRGSIIHTALARVAQVAYRAADQIVVVVAGWEEDLVAAGADERTITVVANGASAQAMAATASRSELRQKFGFDRFTALYAGSQGPKDGLDAVLDAAKECPSVAFCLFGAGVDHDRLQARARTEHIGNVRFSPPVPKTELGDLLAAADVGLHVVADLELHRRAMSPNKLFDYMAAGLPVITNAGPAVGAIVEDAGCGLAVDPTGLSAAVERMQAMSVAERATLGTAGLAAVEATFSRSTMGRRLAGVFDRATQA